MSAAATLARAEAAGVQLRRDGALVRWCCQGQPSADLLAELRQHRDELLVLLASEAAPALIDHDVAEAEAIAAHYAAPAGPPLPAHDPLADGLLRGFHAHRPALAQSSTPLPGARPPSRPGQSHHGQEST